MPEDKIQREIEDILRRLDDFVPEESVGSRVRRRGSDAAGSLARAIIEPLSRISLRHVMLTAIILVFVGFIGLRVNPLVGRWVLIAGVILFLTSFALSFFNRGAPSRGPAVERRWRGQPLDLEEPGLGERIRAWWRARRPPSR
jgi:hypothetical protein